MTDSNYNVIERVGTSTEPWEKATAAAELAFRSLRELKVAEVKELDVSSRTASRRARLTVI